MATVVAKVVGGKPQNITCETVGCVKEQLGASDHTATVNGESASNSHRLSDDDLVLLAKPVKAG